MTEIKITGEVRFCKKCGSLMTFYPHIRKWQCMNCGWWVLDCNSEAKKLLTDE